MDYYVCLLLWWLKSKSLGHGWVAWSRRRDQTSLRVKRQQKFLWLDVRKHSLQDLVRNRHTFKAERGLQHVLRAEAGRCCDHHRLKASQVWAVTGTTSQAAKAKWSAARLPSPPSATWPSNTNASYLVNSHKLETRISPSIISTCRLHRLPISSLIIMCPVWGDPTAQTHLESSKTRIMPVLKEYRSVFTYFLYWGKILTHPGWSRVWHCEFKVTTALLCLISEFVFSLYSWEGKRGFVSLQEDESLHTAEENRTDVDSETQSLGSGPTASVTCQSLNLPVPQCLHL